MRIFLTLSFAAALLCACGDDGPAELVRFDDIPVGEVCLFGGVVVNTGLDDNGNGVLEDNEVDYSDIDCFRHSI
ncbi:MAG: hypothetical protein AAFY60_07705 [Myxococcota bacterium]